MAAIVEIVLFLVLVMVIVAVAAQRLQTAPSILLLAAGILLALLPGLPRVELAPELVLLVMLPPLIYAAGVSMSWREFCFNLRAITLLAFGCVVFTTCAVAAALHYGLGWPWSVAFLLGAIVAPPDVVAPLAIARRLKLPRRILVVLEGEGLANDATALILYRFAVLAISTGSFSMTKAGGTFFAIVLGELFYGVAVGFLSLRLRRWARNPRGEITLSLMTPYLAYLVPETLGGSGILATVAAGLYVSWNGPQLISASTRLQGIFFWDLVIYLIEGFVFLITGLQARTIIERAQDFQIRNLLAAIAITVAVITVARFAWVFPATYVPRWMIPQLRRSDPAPPWQHAFVLSFVGVRGVVSLAAALAIPLTTAAGAAFPYRDQILFATFGVIIVTLIGQGLTLPAVIRWLGLNKHSAAEHRHEQEQELAARRDAVKAAQQHLETLARERPLDREVVMFLDSRHDHRSRLIPLDLDQSRAVIHQSNDIRLELIEAERAFLLRLFRQGKITDESRRRLERDLDLEEAAILARRDIDTPL